MSKTIRSSSRLRVRPEPVPKIGKSERTRAAILDAAFELIWAQPFRDMTVNSLMKSVGVSRSTFYQYFKDLNDLMENLLSLLEEEIFTVCEPWLSGQGDPTVLLRETITGLVAVCYQHGPFLRAVADAAATDKDLERAWRRFMGRFDDVACERIEADQKQGLIPAFEARPVAVALNRLNVYTLIEAFGQRPRRKSEPVRDALIRIWTCSTYGIAQLTNPDSSLNRQ
jgi:AcrR family transcriptional regulator